VIVKRPGGGSGGVLLMDATGTRELATLRDGTEVEILAWHPRRGAETRYRVVARGEAIEGWLGAGSLQPRPAPPPVSVPAAPPPPRRPVVTARATARAVPKQTPRARPSPTKAVARAPKSTRRNGKKPTSKRG
jgi:hypothetical protein